MSFKHVYIPVCDSCEREGVYNYSKIIPEQWTGFIQEGRSELKYVYGKDGWSSPDGSSRSTSSSYYIPEDSIFCSLLCFKKFMQDKIKSIESCMEKLESRPMERKCDGETLCKHFA